MAVALIVEDELQVRVLIQIAFEEAGYETLTAATVTEAIAIIQSDRPLDFVFTDIGLLDEPEGGIQVGQAAAQSRPDAPVLYTSGRGVTDGMIALFAEKNGFVPKPYTLDQVLSATAELLRAPNKGGG
jgi:DNA-binding NtrC family response regulator